MKYLIIFFTCCLATIAACQNKAASTATDSPGSEPTEVATNEPIYKVVSSDEFAGMLKNQTDVQLVDVRRPTEFAQGHIEDALNIDFFGTAFTKEFEKLDKDKPVLLYCRTGKRSKASAKKLSAMGFQEVYDLKGGYLGWVKSGKEK